LQVRDLLMFVCLWFVLFVYLLNFVY